MTDLDIVIKALGWVKEDLTCPEIANAPFNAERLISLVLERLKDARDLEMPR